MNTAVASSLHLAWVANCVGYGNHKYFIMFLAFLVLSSALFTYLCYEYWLVVLQGRLFTGINFAIAASQYNGWVSLAAINSAFHFVWVLLLLLFQLHQVRRTALSSMIIESELHSRDSSLIIIFFTKTL